MDSHLREELAQLDSIDWPGIFKRKPKVKVVNKGGTRTGKDRAGACEQDMRDLLDRYNGCVERLAEAYARDYFRPYASVLAMIGETLETVKRTRGRLFIGDVNKAIVRSLSQEVVPEIYFTLGDRISHYLIDEFQDTSPIQWAALSVLAGNALAEGGTLLIVGDTKQSIYGFRGADWQIMMNLMSGREGFPSAPATVRSLNENRRSGEKVVVYARDLFRHFGEPEIATAAERSGLLGFDQQALPKNLGRGVVEVVRLTRNREEPAERKKILDIIASARKRRYRFSDIAILTPKNEDVIEISGWLNDADIPFISHSSLDVRIQRITTELIALLQFLDSPIDDLAFATFILGEAFPLGCKHAGHPLTHDDMEQFVLRFHSSRRTPLYKAFQQEYPTHWKRMFESLFTVVGYAPLYDLVVEAYKVLDLFAVCPHEGHALAKFLEVVKDFEEGGSNSIKDFLEFTGEEDEEGDWSMDPGGITDAVRLMTVHKSKGLEFRIVIVLLSESGSKGLSPIVFHEADDGMELLHITAGIARRSRCSERSTANRAPQGPDGHAQRTLCRADQSEGRVVCVAMAARDEAKVPCSLLTPCTASDADLPMADPEKARDD